MRSALSAVNTPAPDITSNTFSTSAALFKPVHGTAASGDNNKNQAAYDAITIRQSDFQKQVIALLLERPLLLQEYLDMLQSFNVGLATESIRDNLATAGRSTCFNVYVPNCFVLIHTF